MPRGPRLGAGNVPPADLLTQAGTCARAITEVEATVALSSTLSGSFQVYAVRRQGPLPATTLPPAACLTCENALGIGAAGHPAWSPGLP